MTIVLKREPKNVMKVAEVFLAFAETLLRLKVLKAKDQDAVLPEDLVLKES